MLNAAILAAAISPLLAAERIVEPSRAETERRLVAMFQDDPNAIARLEARYRSYFEEQATAAETIGESRSIAMTLESIAETAGRRGRGLALAALADGQDATLLPTLARILAAIREASLTGGAIDPQLVRDFNATTVAIAALPLDAVLKASEAPDAAAAFAEWRNRTGETLGISPAALANLFGVPAELDGAALTASLERRARELAILDLIDLGLRAEPLLLLLEGRAAAASQSLAEEPRDRWLTRAAPSHAEASAGDGDQTPRHTLQERLQDHPPPASAGPLDEWLEDLVEWSMRRRFEWLGLTSGPLPTGSREAIARLVLACSMPERDTTAVPATLARSLFAPSPVDFAAGTLLADTVALSPDAMETPATPSIEALRRRAALLRAEYGQVLREAKESMTP